MYEDRRAVPRALETLRRAETDLVFARERLQRAAADVERAHEAYERVEQSVRLAEDTVRAAQEALEQARQREAEYARVHDRRVQIPEKPGTPAS